MPVPEHARVVIIGGGAVGVSCLYHLALSGWTDCVLLEKDELTSGSTWHAAGNCPNFVPSWSMMQVQQYSTALYRDLGERVDYPMNYHVNGAVRLSHNKERTREFEHVTAMARALGSDMEMLTVDELKKFYPYMELHDLHSGHWDSLDGDIDPAQLTQAFAKGARDLGARIIRFTPVTGIDRKNDEWQVQTADGSITCEFVVNAAGYRAQEIADMFKPFGGRHLPMVTLAHQYLITEPVDALKDRDAQLPLLRDPDSSYYLRQEKDGLLLGPYERGGKAHWVTPDDPMPDDFSFQLYPDDLDRLEWYIEDACARVPMLGEVGVTRVVNGPIPYSADGNPLIGPMPGVPNAFEACVFTFGIVQAGGAGKVMAEWITEGETEWDMWACDPRRFTGFADQAYANAKGVEIYQHEYAMHFPHLTWPAERNKRLSPLHDELAELGAQFTPIAGWERAAFFDKEAPDPQDAAFQTWERSGPWLEAVRSECETIRDAAGLCDLTGFSRYILKGANSAQWLETQITGRAPKLGRIALCYFADDKGRIITEMTALRLADDEIMLITAAAAEWHDMEWLQRGLADGLTLTNVSEDWSCLLVTGPRSRDILQDVSDADLQRGWLSHQQATVAGQPVLLARVSYVGELGWEIHCPRDAMPPIFEAVWAKAEPLGAKPFGMYALDSLRLEKGYRSWKQDLTTDYTVLEGGLDRFVAFDKPDFTGRDALLSERQRGPKQQFATLTLDANGCDAPYLAPVWQGEKQVGLVTSGGYGHRIDQSIALSVISKQALQDDQGLEVEIYGERVAATRHANPTLYDPGNERLRA